MPSDAINPDEFFQCRQCGKCCKGYGGAYVTERDIDRIARYTESDPYLFVDQFCNISGKRPVLAQRQDGYCIFWDQLCTIHPVKPLMCRKWPFLESILVDSINWPTMANSCPGIQTDIDVEALKKLVKKMILLSWK